MLLTVCLTYHILQHSFYLLKVSVRGAFFRVVILANDLITVFTRLQAAAHQVFFQHFLWLTIKGSLQSRAAYTSFFSLSKCLDDAQSFLGYILLTIPSFRIIFPLICIMCTSVTGGIMMNRRQL